MSGGDWNKHLNLSAQDNHVLIQPTHSEIVSSKKSLLLKNLACNHKSAVTFNALLMLANSFGER